MLRFSFLILILLSISSCSSSVEYVVNEYPIPDRAKHGKFLKATQNAKSNKFAFILTDNVNDIDWKKNALTLMLKNEGYQIIIPKKYGDDDLEILAYGSKQQRINLSYLVYNNLLKTNFIDSASQVILIGFGEGGYLIPELVNKLPINHFFMVNSGKESFIHELYYKLQEKDNSFIKDELLHHFGIDNANQLRIALDELKVKNDNSRSLGNKMNQDWNSYYNTPSSIELAKIKSNGTLLFSQNYPYVSKSSLYYFELFVKNNPYQTLSMMKIEGRGNFNREEEATRLAKTIKDILNLND